MPRKLPVLQNAAAEPEDDRPPWQWVGFGTVALFAAWMPLAVLAQWVASRLSRLPKSASPEEALAAWQALAGADRAREIAAMVVPHALALGVASLAAGFLVGRFGQRTRAREGVSAGAMAGLIAVVLTFAESGLSWPPLVALVLAASLGGLGARAGVRARPGK